MVASLALSAGPAVAGASAPAPATSARAPLAAAAPADQVATDLVNAINEERAKKKTWVGAVEMDTPLKPLTVLDCTTQQATSRLGRWDPSQQTSPDMDAVRAACNLHSQSVGNMGTRPSGAEIAALWMSDTSRRQRMLGAFTNVGVACLDVGAAKGGWQCEAIFSNPAQVGGLGPDKPVGQLPVMIFGDSYTSGNGVGDGVKGWRVGLPGGDPKTNSFQSPRSQSRVMAEMLAGWTGRPYCGRADQNGSNCVVVNDYSHSGSVTMAPTDEGGELFFPVVIPPNIDDLMEADSEARSGLEETKTLKQQVDQALIDAGGAKAMLPQGVIIVGIGGNDIAFGKIARKVLIPLTQGGSEEAKKVIDAADGLLEPAMVRAQGQITRLIQSASPNSVVLVQGYPYLANSDGSAEIRECWLDGKVVSSVKCFPVIGSGGTWRVYQPASDLRHFQDAAESRYQKMVNDLRPIAETYGVEVRFVPYATATDGQAPYLANGDRNPNRGITTAFQVGDEHSFCDGFVVCSKMNWIHPAARLRAQEGGLLFSSLTASPVDTAARQVVLGLDSPGDKADEYPPKLTTPVGSLPVGKVGEAYGTVFQADGINARYSVQGSGRLPDGLHLYASGALSGTPTRAGDYTFTVRASTTVGSVTKYDEVDYTINIDERAPDSPATIKAPTPDSPPPTATVGQDYSFTIESTGSPRPIFAVSEGELPPGMYLYPSTGEIGGMPALPGDYSFTVAAYNTVGGQVQLVSVPFAFHVALPDPDPEPPVITVDTAPVGTVGVAYSFAVEATGNPAPVFAVTDGALPPGLDLDPVTGAITGTPTADGTYVFTVTASNTIDGKVQSDSAELTIQVSLPAADPAPPVITLGTVPVGTVGAAYSFTVEAVGNPAPTFAVTDGALPPGLDLDPATGTVSGLPALPGSYTVTVTASNTIDGETQSSSVRFDIHVDLPAAAPVITSGAAPVGMVGSAYAFTVQATGNPAPRFEVTDGALPPGLDLDPATGAITGTPTTDGEYVFTVTASNTVDGQARSDSAELTVVVAQAGLHEPPVITAGTAPTGTVGMAYTFTVQATGTPAPTFAVTEGALPPGLSLDADTGTVSGLPALPGDYTVTVTASNTVDGVTQTDSAQYTIHVDLPGAPPVITVGTVPAATVGVAYTFTIETTGSPAPTFAVTEGTLPEGLTLDPVTGTVSGTPTVAGEYTVTVTASNTFDGATQTDSARLTIVVAQAGTDEVPPVVTVGTVPVGTVGVAYTFTVQATGKPAPTFAVTDGDLPAGLALDPVTGTIAGTPTKAGDYIVTVTASNTVDGQARSDSAQLTIKVNQAGLDEPPVITPGTAPAGTVGVAYTFTVQATGNPVPTFAVTDGSLPAGLSLDPATGAITGMPALPGDYAFTVTASNTVDGVAQSDSAQYTVHVGLGDPPGTPPTITSGAAPVGVVGVAYTFTVQATGNPAPTFAVTEGTLPAGLVLDPVTGTVSGTPTVAGEYAITVTASNTIDGQTQSDSVQLTIQVNKLAGLDEPPVITPGTAPAGKVGVAYTFTVQATGKPAPTFAVTGGDLPAGLTLDPVTGTVSGTPTEAGEYAFTVTASNTVDGQARSDSARFTIRVDRAGGTPTPDPTSTPSGGPTSTPSDSPSGTPSAAPGDTPARLPLTGAGATVTIAVLAGMALLLGLVAVGVRRRTS